MANNYERMFIICNQHSSNSPSDMSSMLDLRNGLSDI